ncbi:MAG: hypothetical protein A4S09_07905 [Proteobacteria bacterium SG_bin7]|nr:MAG: hypothetical protein A4S09_07905 [Proteobacteria bacterium SG_bin7]
MKNLMLLLIALAVDNATASVTKEEFAQTLESIEKTYKPIFKKKFDANFVVENYWDDATVNAHARRMGKSWFIAIFGGLGRNKLMTTDGLALVACHEIGAHIGGFPKESEWATKYMQSAYFTGLKCMRELWENDDNIEKISRMQIDPIVRKHCALSFDNDQSRALCMRSVSAAFVLSHLLAQMNGQEAKIIDPEVYQDDETKLPSYQCSFNTYFSGALCGVDHKVDVSQVDARIGTCNKSDGHKIGYRPACWYKE